MEREVRTRSAGTIEGLGVVAAGVAVARDITIVGDLTTAEGALFVAVGAEVVVDNMMVQPSILGVLTYSVSQIYSSKSHSSEVLQPLSP